MKGTDWREQVYIGNRIMGIKPSGFRDERHRIIEGIFQELESRGETVELPAVVGALRESGKLEEAGGAAYLASLIDLVPGGGVAQPEPGEGRIHPVILQQFLAAEDKPLEEHIEGLLGVGDRLLVPGPPKAGKSLLMRTLALCLTTGARFCGRPVRYAPVPALWLDLEEGEVHLRRSFRRLSRGMGLSQDAIQRAPLHLASASSFSLVEHKEELAKLIFAEGIRAVFIDTLRRAMPPGGGLSEKDSEWGAMVAQVVDFLRASAKEPLLVALITHTKKGASGGTPVWETARGTGDLAAGVDTIWSIDGSVGEGAKIRFLRRHTQSPDDLNVVLEEDGEALRIVSTGSGQKATDTGTVIAEVLLQQNPKCLNRGDLERALVGKIGKQRMPSAIKEAIAEEKCIVRQVGREKIHWHPDHAPPLEAGQ